MFSELENLGIPAKKSILVRCAEIFFLEDTTIIEKYPQILQRCTNIKSTEKLLSEIYRDLLPKTKLILKDKKENKKTTFSTQFTPESIKIINEIIHSDKIQSIFERLEEYGLILSKSCSTVKSILIRASVCYLLSYRLNEIRKNPLLYQRTVTLQSSEKTLEKIYQEKYKENSKK